MRPPRRITAASPLAPLVFGFFACGPLGAFGPGSPDPDLTASNQPTWKKIAECVQDNLDQSKDLEDALEECRHPIGTSAVLTVYYGSREGNAIVTYCPNTNDCYSFTTGNWAAGAVGPETDEQAPLGMTLAGYPLQLEYYPETEPPAGSGAEEDPLDVIGRDGAFDRLDLAAQDLRCAKDCYLQFPANEEPLRWLPPRENIFPAIEFEINRILDTVGVQRDVEAGPGQLKREFQPVTIRIWEQMWRGDKGIIGIYHYRATRGLTLYVGMSGRQANCFATSTEDSHCWAID